MIDLDSKHDIEDLQELNVLVEKLSNQLAEHFHQTILSFSEIVFRLERYYEGSHSKFVSSKSEKVAQLLNLDETAVTEIKIAGLLHDIGKVGFSESLLSKFGSELLDFEIEENIMHPEIGKNILKKVDGFKTIGEIIYQHHERIDGKGFPRRLQGKEIQPGAAIIAVVDTFHNIMYRIKRDRNLTAMSTLSYSSTSTYLETTRSRYGAAVYHLHQKAGTHFDKKVVEIFTQLMEEERKTLGDKFITRLPANKVEPGMIFAEDYFDSKGMLLAAKGETATEFTIMSLLRYAEKEDIPFKILVFR